MLLTMLIVEPPSGKSFAGLRAVLLLPSFLALIALGTTGPVDGCGSTPAEPCVPAVVISDTARNETGVIVSADPVRAPLDILRLEAAPGVSATCVSWGQGGAGGGNCTAAVYQAERTERTAVYLQDERWALWHYAFAAMVFLVLLVQVMGLLIKPV